MSKYSLFWGDASGKLGQAVFYRAGGEQRTRTYIKQVKNPKTLAQVENRLSMANLVQTYKLWNPILRQAFPLKKSNQSDYNAFISANKNYKTAVITKGLMAGGLSVPLSMVMSDGDLLGVITTNAELTTPFDAAATSRWGRVVSGLLPSNKSYSADDITDKGLDELNTSGQLYDAIVGENNPNNLPSEFKVTVLLGQEATSDLGDDPIDIAGIKPSYAYILVKKGGTETWTKVGNIDSPVLYLANWDVTGAGEAQTGVAGNFAIGLASDTQFSLGFTVATLIISYTDASGKLRVTKSVFGNFPNSEGQVAAYQPGGEVYEIALNQWGYNQGGILPTR